MRPVIARLVRCRRSFTDNPWLVESTTPVECGRCGETQRRSDLANRATYGCRASTRTRTGSDGLRPLDRQTLKVPSRVRAGRSQNRRTLHRLGMLSLDSTLAASGQIFMADKGLRAHQLRD
jgi:hypothetical protein